MNVIRLSALAVLIAAASPAFALDAVTTGTAATKPGAASATQVTTVTAQIASIVPETRTITLKQPNGRSRELVLGDDVRNFEQLKVGDMVTVEYREEITLALMKDGDAARAATQTMGATRSQPGEKPGGTVQRQVTVLADVQEINAKEKTVTLRGPQGNLVDLKVEDPEQLKNVKTGDQVRAVYTEALAIKVEPAPAATKN